MATSAEAEQLVRSKQQSIYNAARRRQGSMKGGTKRKRKGSWRPIGTMPGSQTIGGGTVAPDLTTPRKSATSSLRKRVRRRGRAMRPGVRPDPRLQSNPPGMG